MDIARIEAYNKKLEELQRESAEAQSAVKFHAARVKESCEQLSQLLGFQVTEENLEQVYEDYQKKVENTLRTGEEIMHRIEEQRANLSGAPVVTAGQAGQAGQAGPAGPVQMSGMGSLIQQVGIQGQPAMAADEPIPVQVPIIPPIETQAPGTIPGMGAPVGFGAAGQPVQGHVWGMAEGQGIRQQPGGVNI